MDKLNASSQIWLEVGVSSLNTLRYIDVSSLYTHLGSLLCASLAGFHAFTGCDYTASFSRRGKSRPLKLLQKDPDPMTLFGNMGNRETVTAEQLKIAENFVCKMYGKTKCESVDDARLDTFFKRYKPKKNDSPISCVRKMDGSFLPPCSHIVLEKLKRTNYVCSIWLNAFGAHPPDFNPENCGWVMKEGAYKILWFEGDYLQLLLMVSTSKIMVKMRITRQREMMVTKMMRMIQLTMMLKMMLIKMMSTKILILRDHLHVLEMLDMLKHKVCTL